MKMIDEEMLKNKKSQPNLAKYRTPLVILGMISSNNVKNSSLDLELHYVEQKSEVVEIGVEIQA